MNAPGATLREATPGLVRERHARLTVSAGGHDRIIEVPEAGLSIGSDPGCDVALNDATVSRQHAEIRRAGIGYLLKDLGSTNGTFVGQHRIESLYLNDGTAFRVGRTTLAFSCGENAVDVEPSQEDHFCGLVGTSEPMRKVYAAIARYAKTDLAVVVEGETGTGKELVARALHDLSGRSSGPLIALNCGAFSPGLIEDELFGHEQGAFTGAVRSRPGAFEQAHGGTLFLDEIGELPLELQPKLLRALETFEVRRLGGRGEHRVDVRVVSATNHDLAADTAAGRFRRDLFFRLSEVRLHLPPLADRPEDIPALVAHFAKGSGKRFSRAAIEALALRPWPGNVRELAALVRRALADSAADEIGVEAAGSVYTPFTQASGPSLQVPLDQPISKAREQVLEAFHRVYLNELLRRHGGDLHATARAAGVHVNSLHRLLRNAGLRQK